MVNRDGLEGWPMSVKKHLISRGVVEAHPLLMISEQRWRMTIKLWDERLEVETTHVDA